MGDVWLSVSEVSTPRGRLRNLLSHPKKGMKNALEKPCFGGARGVAKVSKNKAFFGGHLAALRLWRKHFSRPDKAVF
jgi:hypothetical protein